MKLIPIRLDEPDHQDYIVQSVCVGTKSLYKHVGFRPPWIGYLCLLEDTIVGTCAFKSAPREGRVEIAYFTFPQNEGRGYATQMAAELVKIAKAEDSDVLVFAQTEPQKNASNALLEKIGFKFAGEVMHPDDGRVWEWHFED